LEAEPSIQNFCAYVAITAGNILTDQGYKTDGMGAYFESLWLQEHHKHSGMDQHTHPGALMVGFYFLDVPDGSPAATFFDPRAGKVAAGPDEANSHNVTYASPAFHLALKRGLLVFTNSWLAHAFTRHAADTPFRFVHFNIGLTEHRPNCDVEVI
jgi:uncharacterized protein (TIGR02466 family)